MNELMNFNNKEQTMSSLEFWNGIISPARKSAGEGVSSYQRFFSKVVDELDIPPGTVENVISEKINNLGFKVKYETPSYNLTLEQMTLVGMRESKAVRRSVLETLKKLQHKETDEEIMMRGYMLTVKKYEQLQQTLIMKDAVIEVQEEQIHNLKNLFTEGMNPTIFARQLNGVNSMEMLKVLADIKWLYKREWESEKGNKGVNYYAFSNARDKYLRNESYTPKYKGALPVHHVVLLKEGAVKLYEMYLDGKLPMKKGWDGKFTHDVL